MDNRILTPAVSQLDKRSLYLTYDLSPYLKKGDNEIVVWLGQGWYRPGMPGCVYEGPLLKAHLDKYIKGTWTEVLKTDTSWQVAESGYASIGTWQWQQFGGEQVNALATPENMDTQSLDRLKWHNALCVEVPEHTVSPQMSEDNFIVDIFKPTDLKQLGDSVWLIDMGKCMTGWAEASFSGLQKGQTITLEYSDQLDKNGNLVYQAQTDFFIASGKANEIFCNKFSYHGFQYIRISGLKNFSVNDVKGLLVHAGFGEGSSFRCSDSDMNAIHDMIQYTLRCLSLGGYIVDCPHLERIGYGGDGSASTAVAQTMFDLSPLYANWLQAWADCQREDGHVPYAAPYPYWLGGGPYYSGFIITASWQSYLNYGDIRFIEKYYSVMQHWLKYVEQYSPDGLLAPWPDQWYLGDWAAPDSIDQDNGLSVDLVSNCFISTCYLMMEKIASRLGKNDDTKKYAEARKVLNKQIHKQFFSEEKNTYATGTQIDLAFPLLAGVTPEILVPKVTESLICEIEKHKGHLATGLVGIPVLTEWAIKNNQPDMIYSMLKKKDYPGYLFMLENGATTTWEHWETNGKWSRSRIHNCYNGIALWFYHAIGGIRPDENDPGYKKVIIDPQIPEGITWAETSKETPYGRLTVKWKLIGKELELSLIIPPGCSASIALPDKVKKYNLDGKICKRNGQNEIVVESGKYKIAYLFDNK
jgi:alpha-L-rhamnosidase